MSALQRVEETYLGILRLVIIVASSLLLVAAIVFGVMAVSNMRGGERPEPKDTTVKIDDVINKVASSPAKDEVHAQNRGAKKQVAPLSSDPNQKFYDRTSAAILKFVSQYGKGQVDVSAERVTAIVKERAEKHGDTPQTVTAFASGLAETMEKGLASPGIIKRVDNSAQASPTPQNQAAQDGEATPVSMETDESQHNELLFRIVDELINTYAGFFEEQQSMIAAEKARAAAAEIERKEASMMQLYVAAGAFSSFLFLVFISIVVKIERNLRNLGSLLPKPGKSISASESSST